MCGGRACARHVRVARCQYCTCLVGYSCCHCASLSSLVIQSRLTPYGVSPLVVKSSPHSSPACHTRGKTAARCHPSSTQSSRCAGLLRPAVRAMVRGTPSARFRSPHPLPLQATPARHSGICQIPLVCRLCRHLPPPGGRHPRAWTYWPRPLPITCRNLETRPAMLMGRFTSRARTIRPPLCHPRW
jgi:hypothetical protein